MSKPKHTHTLIDKYMGLGVRSRTFYFSWCGKTVTDYVCTSCNTIVQSLGVCTYCEGRKEKATKRLEDFLAARVNADLDETETV